MFTGDEDSDRKLFLSSIDSRNDISVCIQIENSNKGQQRYQTIKEKGTVNLQHEIG